jgi:colicin import membrane protein
MNGIYDKKDFFEKAEGQEPALVRSFSSNAESIQKAAKKDLASKHAAAIAKLEKAHSESAAKLADALTASNNELEQIKQEATETGEALANQTLVSTKYLYLVPAMADILTNGRADSLKEALNLAIADERDKKERNARRNHEAEIERIARRESELRAEEEREFAQRQRDREERETKRAEEDRQRRKEQDEREKERQANEDEALRKATAYHCMECAHYAGCPTSRTKYGLNCTAFRQRESSFFPDLNKKK